MSKAIDEMRAYFNQMPVPPKGALLEARKKVNAMIDAVEAENDNLLKELRELAKDMHNCARTNSCSRCYFVSEKCEFANRMRELGVEYDPE